MVLVALLRNSFFLPLHLRLGAVTLELLAVIFDAPENEVSAEEIRTERTESC